MFEVDGQDLMFEGVLVYDSKGLSVVVPAYDGVVLLVLEESPSFFNECRDGMFLHKKYYKQ